MSRMVILKRENDRSGRTAPDDASLGAGAGGGGQLRWACRFAQCCFATALPARILAKLSPDVGRNPPFPLCGLGRNPPDPPSRSREGLDGPSARLKPRPLKGLPSRPSKPSRDLSVLFARSRENSRQILPPDFLGYRPLQGPSRCNSKPEAFVSGPPKAP